jgi:hypothetical protein
MSPKRWLRCWRVAINSTLLPVFICEGHWDADGTAMAGAIQRVAQLAGVNAKVKAFPWWLISVMRTF